VVSTKNIGDGASVLLAIKRCFKSQEFIETMAIVWRIKIWCSGLV